MKKNNHSRRPLILTSLSFVLVLFSFISVAYGDSHPVNKAIENSKTLTKDCEAAFYAEANEGVLSSSEVHFYNFSEGDYDDLQWDFGDGNTSSATVETVSHNYSASGSYNVTLTIWSDNMGCYSSKTEQIFVTAINDDPCLISSCVYPGDANNDNKADLSDLMHIGIGFGKTGPERPDADPMEWTGQPGPDWPESTADGVNYKHFDSDGSGTIDYQDIMPILHHYSPMNTGLQHTNNNSPKVYLDFEVDSILIKEDSESTMTFSAGLIIGSADNPMEDIYGMSLYFGYDSTLTETYDGVVVDFNNNCFFGDETEVIAHGEDLRSKQQADVVLTRLDGQNTSGHGRVATINFIVIIDIIDGRTERTVPFDVPISGITVVDREGNIIPVSLVDKPAGVVFVKEYGSTTGTGGTGLERLVSVFPNPATDLINITLTDLEAESLQMYNALGKLVRDIELGQTANAISTADLSSGVYTLNIQTDQGLVNKRVVIK